MRFFGVKQATLAAALMGSMLLVARADAQGLAGTFYNTGGTPILNLADAQSYIGSHSATGTFKATTLNYAASDTTTIITFLGSDAASYTGANANFSDGIVTLSGFITLPSGGTKFTLGSDDGSSLSIGGTQLINFDGLHAATPAMSNTFNAPTAGQYAFTLTYFNHANGSNGFAGLQVLENDVAINPSTLSTTLTAAAPEPGSLALALGAALPFGVGIIRRRRKK